jgi:hypothetical protein
VLVPETDRQVGAVQDVDTGLSSGGPAEQGASLLVVPVEQALAGQTLGLPVPAGDLFEHLAQHIAVEGSLLLCATG